MKLPFFILMISLMLVNPGQVTRSLHFVTTTSDVSKIAFAGFDSQTGYMTVFTIKSDGSNLKPIFRDEDPDFECSACKLTWSPDYRFMRVTPDGYKAFSEIYGIYKKKFNIIISSDGANVHTYNSDYIAFKWSSDGKHLAYLYKKDRKGNDSRLELFIADADGSNPRQFSNREVTDFFWSPDSTQLAISSAGTIYVASIDNDTKLTSLTTTDLQLYGLDWSPDGQYISFIYRTAVYLLNVKTHVIHKTSVYIDYTGYSWSPTENKVLAGYLVLDVNAMKQFTLGIPTTYNISWTPSLRWSPDGLQLLYPKMESGFGALFTWTAPFTQSPVELNTPVVVKSIYPVLNGAWDMNRIGLNDGTWSPDSHQIAYIWHDQICIIRNDSSNPYCITDPIDQYSSIGGVTWAVTPDLIEP